MTSPPAVTRIHRAYARARAAAGGVWHARITLGDRLVVSDDDGIRHDLPGPARTSVATKHGADHDARGAARHEAGVMFTADGTPALVYSLFAHALGAPDDHGPTHPAAKAHAALGRILLESM